MSKRIALMTWHNTQNYGTAFQAYALSRLIERTGNVVVLVDYKRLGNSPLSKLSFIQLFNGYICALLKRVARVDRSYSFMPNTFNSFWQDNFTYTKIIKDNQDFKELNLEYDGFVCGSDQIWGPEWFDARFFLDFVEDNNRLIAYAPSIGVPEVTNINVANEMARLMSRFAFLSVREETGCRIVSRLTGRSDVVNVLDPVLALPTAEWDGIKEPVQNLLPRYMFIFFLKNNEENIKTSLEAAKAKGIAPIVLHCTQSEDTPFANTGDLTPGQILTYIQNAEYVCTDSFHITVLSIIFCRNFKVFKKDSVKSKTSKNNRITDLLNRFGINNAEYDINPSFEVGIDYQKVNPILETLRKDSFSYLKGAVEHLPVKRYESSSQLKCEKISEIRGWCNGEQTEAFVQYGFNKKGIQKWMYAQMQTFPFAMKEKCYLCKYYKVRGKFSDKRKPLFWGELQCSIQRHESSFKIFRKYYFAYYISSKIGR